MGATGEGDWGGCRLHPVENDVVSIDRKGYSIVRTEYVAIKPSAMIATISCIKGFQRCFARRERIKNRSAT